MTTPECSTHNQYKEIAHQAERAWRLAITFLYSVFVITCFPLDLRSDEIIPTEQETLRGNASLT